MLDIKVFLGFFRHAYLWLAICFVLFIAWKNLPNFQDVAFYIKSISISIVALCLLLAACSYGFRTRRWLGYMRLVEDKFSAQRHILIYLSGFVFTASPGKSGELIRGTYLTHLGVPFRYTFYSFVSERLLDVVTVLFLGSYLLIQHFNTVFLALSILMITLPFMVSFVLGYICSLSYSMSVSDLKSELGSLWKKEVVAKSMLYSLLAWSGQSMILYLILSEFGTEISVPMAISCYCLSLLIGALSLVPGGIGITELGMTWLLTQLGVDNHIAIIASLITRVMTLWPVIIIGLICSFILNKRAKIDY